MGDLQLEDRVRVEELAIANAYTLDDQDWDTFEALYVPHAIIDHRSAGGVTDTPAEVAAWMAGASEMFSWSMQSMSPQRLVKEDVTGGRFAELVRTTVPR